MFRLKRAVAFTRAQVCVAEFSFVKFSWTVAITKIYPAQKCSRLNWNDVFETCIFVLWWKG